MRAVRRTTETLPSFPALTRIRRHAPCAFPDFFSRRQHARTLTHLHAQPLPGSQICRHLSSSTAASPKLAYIALGSNIGDRVANIERACSEMDARGIRVRRTSSLWETRPMYVEDQDMFVNGACEVETSLEPLALLDALQAIETHMGREKMIDKGPRNIDLDILLYDKLRIQDKRLNIPHIGLPEREFMLRPLAELVPHASINPSDSSDLVKAVLDALPPSDPPIRTLTPLSLSVPNLSALDPARTTRVMAILNVTPDSFTDGGRHSPSNPEAFRATVRDLVTQVPGVILDVGGQSTRPGAEYVSADEEIARVVPAIRLIRSVPQARHVPVSVDTFHASVAEAAVAEGADIINDVSGGTFDPAMLPTAARLGGTVVLMHTRGGSPQAMHLADSNTYPDGVVAGVGAELLERVQAAEAAGVRRWRIVLDPGLGFAKRGPQNAGLLREFHRLRAWPGLEGLPWLVGPSKKGFVAHAVLGMAKPPPGAEEAEARAWGTAAAVAAAVAGGADIVRVHDAREMGHVVKMADALWRAGG